MQCVYTYHLIKIDSIERSIMHPARFTFLCLMLECALFFHAHYSVAFKQTMVKFCVTSRPQSLSGKSAFHVEREKKFFVRELMKPVFLLDM